MISLWLFTLLKLCTKTIKNSKDQLNIIKSHIARGKNELELFVMSCNNIWTNLILILSKIVTKQSKV